MLCDKSGINKVLWEQAVGSDNLPWWCLGLGWELRKSEQVTFKLILKDK